MPEPANPNAQPTNAPTKKTIAATGGTVVGGAIATIILYLIEKYWGKLPDTVSEAVTVLVSAVFTFSASYFTPHGAMEGIVKDASGRVMSAR
jgi:hypothetical protein